MTPAELMELLASVKAGRVEVEDAVKRVGELPFTEVVDGVVDHHRELRTGIPELVYGASKTATQIATMLGALAARADGCAMATRVDAEKAARVTELVEGAVYDPVARTVTLGKRAVGGEGKIAVVCAGTSDLPVHAEVCAVVEFLGVAVLRVVDVGVAGLHRLLARVADIKACDVVVVIAGMEAALPSVLGGLVDRPMIGVPTSVGYGVSLDGLVALAGMLASCAPGITVVNIDNGVGAAIAAVRIARLAAR